MAKSYNIAAVYTQEDKKVGRNQEIKKSEVKVVAEGANIPVFEPKKFDEEALISLKSIGPELIIVAAYGKILPSSVLKASRFGCINVHASLLPKFRGPSPIQNALLRGEKETGSTIMLMNEGVDTGDIISQEKIEIRNDETYPELSRRLSDLSTKLLLEVIPLWTAGEIKQRPQNNSKAVLCQLIERSDGKINWTDQAKEIYNRYRAFLPWPGIFTYWEKNGLNMRLKLNKISYSETEKEDSSRHLGKVFRLGEKIAVKTSLGSVILEEIQPEGKSNMKISDFINGNADFVGGLLK